MAATKKKRTRPSASQTSSKKPAGRSAASRKAERAENRIFTLTVAFTVLALVFLWFSLLRYS